MKCTVSNSRFLSTEDLESINKAHEGFFIKGLTFSDQSMLVKHIAGTIYRDAIQNKKSDVVELKKDLLDTIIKETKNTQNLIRVKSLLKTADSEQSIMNAERTLSKYKSIIDNIDRLFMDARDLLSTLEGTVFKNTDNVSINDLFSTDEDITEAGIERTTFNENFYFELDTKHTASADLRKFLAFIPKYEYDSEGNKKPVQTIIGTQQYFEFEHIFNELHRLLIGSKPSEQEMLKTLQIKANEADLSKNKSNAWIGEFIKYFNSKNIPPAIKKEFVSEMAKHKIDMNFIMWNKKWNKATEQYDYSLHVYNDNSGSVSNRLINIWKKEFLHTELTKEGIYNKEEKIRLLLELNDIKKIQGSLTSSELADRIHKVLTQIGIMVNKEYFNSLYNTNSEFKFGDKKVYPRGFTSIIINLIDKIQPNTNVEDYDIIHDNFIKKLAADSTTFETEEFSNSFRVGDKIIYTYSINQYLVNRFRDLKSDTTLRKDLSESIFSRESIYLSLINNDNYDLKDWFDFGYVSLQPLKKRNGQRSDKITDIGNLDHEVTKVGFFNFGFAYTPVTINGNTLKTRKAQYFFPTTSDKSRVMSVKGIAFDSTERYISEKTKQLTVRYSKQAIDTFYDVVILPEINRIHDTSKKEFKDALNLATFKGDEFFLFPELNKLKFNYKGEELSLIDIIKLNNDLPVNVQEEVKKVIKKTLNKEANDKIKSWRNLGITDTKGNINYINTVKNSESYESNLRHSNEKDGNFKNIVETAMDMVYNYAIFNTNMFQMVIGDPSQYFKKNVQGTYDNITKRLAAEIAPKIEMEGEDYVQVFADDIITESSNIDYLEKLFRNDKDSLDKYKKINSTDAQEYTTWKEHLNILLYLGKIDQTEYDEASNAFSAGKEPSKEVFSKVLQPLKPLYSYNKIENIGNSKFDVKTYIKSSSFPLIPSLTKGLEIDDLRVEMEKLEAKTSKGVRLAFKSAVKVGFTSNKLELAEDKTGTFKTTINLEGKYKVLKRAGFGIQQDIPYDENKNEVNKGSQESKLLWANFHDPELYKRYIDLYQQLYEHGISKLNQKIKNREGKVDNSKLSKILTRELKRKGETNKSLYDGLKLNEVGEFVIPLWLSPYADSYMYLISSIVKNNIVSHKLPGKSYVLGSNAGFKTRISEESAEQINKRTGIVFTDSYDEKKGLQINYDKNGKLQSAQVIVPFKFRDNKGKLLSIKQFITEGNKLDLNRLPKDILKLFGFRIPTQLHANMSVIEIVGFLPKTNGDLIIAPAEFTVQMGSDFDVDKLYTYMYSTNYDSVEKKLSKKKEVVDYREKIKDINNLLNKEKSTLEGISISELEGRIDDIIDRDGIVSLTAYQLKEELKAYYPEVNVGKYAELYLAKEELNTNYLGGIHNSILDIHIKQMENPDIQSSIHTPLGQGLHDEIIKKLDTLQDKQEYTQSVIFDEYQKKKFYDGTAGKAGIGMFSLDSVFNVLAQNKALQLLEPKVLEEGKLIKVPITVIFGNKYEKSDGNLSSIYTLRKGAKRLKTDVISASQSLSVDNANLQGMHKINMNQYTFSVYSILNFLGFEEDISDLFMSQPIIREYVDGMVNNASILKDYNPKAEEELVQSLITKYGGDEYKADIYDNLADFTGMDASEFMFNLIDKGSQINKFGLYQASILRKFMYLKDRSKVLNGVKSLLNIDSKGFDKSMYINKKKLDTLYTAKDSYIKNVDRLFGEYMQEGEDVIIIPNTTAGFDNIYGNKYLLDNFSNYFLESKQSLGFNKIVNLIENITGKFINETRLFGIRNAYKYYLLSNINTTNIDSLRDNLFNDKSEESLYKRLLTLKDTKYGKSNAFLNNLEVNFTSALEVDYNNSGGDAFDKTRIYKAFVDMFRDNEPIKGVIPAHIVEDLILYSILRGGNKAQQFMEFIPVSVIQKIVDIPTNNLDERIFVDQYIRHNLDLVPSIEEYNLLDDVMIEVFDTEATYVKIEKKDGNVKLYRKAGENIYELIDALGIENTTEYSPYMKENSVFKKNQKVRRKESYQNPLKKGYITVDNTLDDTDSSINGFVQQLNLDSSTALLQSIIKLKDTHKEEALLAEALLPYIDENIKLVLIDTGTSSYNQYTNTLELNIPNLSYSDNSLTTILHEYLHSLSSGLIKKYETGEDLPANIRAAITRLNGFKDRIITDLTPEQQKIFRSFLAVYADRQSKTPGRLEYLLSKKTLHPTVRVILQDTLELTNDGVTDKTAYLSKLIQEFELMDRATEKSYYALTNLDEFIANSGSDKETRDTIVKLSKGTYLDKIKHFFEELLKYLGITDEVSKALMDDILTVTSVKQINKQASTTDETYKESTSTQEEQDLTSLEMLGKELIKQCKGSNPIAKNGMKSSINKGSKWGMVKDLKGLPSHEQGGVDLSIVNGKVHFTTKSGKIHARYGLKVTKKGTNNNTESKKNSIFTPGAEWNVLNMKCGGYAEKGAIIPFIKQNKESLNSNKWSVLNDYKNPPKARCGCLIRKNKTKSKVKEYDYK